MDDRTRRRQMLGINRPDPLDGSIVFDVMQVCRNGHKITGQANSRSELRRARCSRCGAETVMQCDHCGSAIPGHMKYPGIGTSDDSNPPNFCEKCGKPFPWHKRTSHEVQMSILQAILDNESPQAEWVGLTKICEVTGLSSEDAMAHMDQLEDENKLMRAFPRDGGLAVMLESKGRVAAKTLPTSDASPSAGGQPVKNSEPVEIKESLARFRADHPDGSKLAFIMMRFDVSPAHEKIVQAIRKTLLPHGMTALRADDKQYHDDTYWNILTYIYGCGIGFAVFERITTDDFNPNVSLEVGYMLGLRREVCLLKDRTLKQLHTDLVGKLYRVFDLHDIGKSIEKEVGRWLSDKGII